MSTIVAAITALLSNQVFIGVGGGAILGGLMVALRSVPAKIWSTFLHLFTVEVHIENDDEAFNLVDKFLAQHEGAQRARTIRVSSRYNRHDPNSGNKRSWVAGAGLGAVWFLHGWRPTRVSRTLTETKNEGSTREYFTIRMFGRSRQPLLDMLNEALKLEDTSTITIYTYDRYWESCANLTPRSPDTLILKGDQLQTILADAKWFDENRDFYHDRGIPYHRGYLFSGEPGCGKTSIIPILAHHINRDVCSLSLSAIETDAELLSAIATAPANAIIALEDIDAATKAAKTREDGSDGVSEGVTLAGLLNALDGLVTPDGRIYAMTTNHPDRLDPALIRKGRVDRHEHFDFLYGQDQIRMVSLFFDEPFSREEPISPAALQSILIDNMGDREAAKSALENYK